MNRYIADMPSVPAVVWCLAVTGLGACATITTGADQTVFIATPKVHGAACDLFNAKGQKWQIDNTPGPITFRRASGSITIICRKSGYKSSSLVVDGDAVGATLGNIVFGGDLGLLIDEGTGAAIRYPDKIVIWMEPSSFASDSDRRAWQEEKSNFERVVSGGSTGDN